MSSTPEIIEGVLILYYQPLSDNAPTILEHVDAFSSYSAHAVYQLNTELGFPRQLARFRFRVVVLHYSVVYKLPADFIQYLQDQPPELCIAFFQDEHHNVAARHRLIDMTGVSTVFTCFEPADAAKVYALCVKVDAFIHTLTGYVSDQMIAAAARFAKPDEERRLDIGYRGRQLAFYMGRGAQEKYLIGTEFRERARNLGLKLDIETDEQSRIYGDGWYKFLADSRGTLGVESGVSIVDLTGEVQATVASILASEPDLDFETVSQRAGLDQYENLIPYRTVSPRHFEAAAFRVCQIQFEGEYEGILRAEEHYIPLRKDFSNFDEVIQRFRDPTVRSRITNNAHRDLVESGRYHFRAFVSDFDAHLTERGILPAHSRAQRERVAAMLAEGSLVRKTKARLRALGYQDWPGKPLVKRIARRWIERVHAAENPVGVIG